MAGRGNYIIFYHLAWPFQIHLNSFLFSLLRSFTPSSTKDPIKNEGKIQLTYIQAKDILERHTIKQHLRLVKRKPLTNVQQCLVTQCLDVLKNIREKKKLIKIKYKRIMKSFPEFSFLSAFLLSSKFSSVFFFIFLRKKIHKILYCFVQQGKKSWKVFGLFQIIKS